MTKTFIDKITPLSRHAFNPNHYTLELINEASRLGLIDQKSLNNFQTQIMSLLTDLIIKYTKGESTSIKVETAQRILGSILYVIDTHISSFENPEDAIELINAGEIKMIYKDGLDLVLAFQKETETLYQEIKNNKLDIPIKAYQSTIDDALPGFFKIYDAHFQAQDTMAGIDYPLLFDEPDLQGIVYIKQYLEKLSLETQFCRLFPIEDIGRVLLDYGRVYCLDYRDALINIFEIILTNCIFSVLSSNQARQPVITPYKYELLCDRLNGLDHPQCLTLVSDAIETLISDLCIDQAQLKNYMRDYVAVLMPRLMNALNHNSLANVVIVAVEKDVELDIVFDEGSIMDDESFRALVDQIIECEDGAEKAAIIASGVRSLGDFIDVLEADCLFDDEFSCLFNTLGDMELSILARIAFIEDLRSDPTAFSLQNITNEGLEIEWQIELAKFFPGLDSYRLQSIDHLIHSSLQAKPGLG